jgi:hypothetical protein
MKNIKNKIKKKKKEESTLILQSQLPLANAAPSGDT